MGKTIEMSLAGRLEDIAQDLTSMKERNTIREVIARLTALQQELAQAKKAGRNGIMALNVLLGKQLEELTAAEQRNADFVELLERMLKDDDMPVHWFAQSIDELLAKPAE